MKKHAHEIDTAEKFFLILKAEKNLLPIKICNIHTKAMSIITKTSLCMMLNFVLFQTIFKINMCSCYIVCMNIKKNV